MVHLHLEIVDNKYSRSGGTTHVEYEIRVTVDHSMFRKEETGSQNCVTDRRTHTVHRRFREFDKLHTALSASSNRKHFGKLRFPSKVDFSLSSNAVRTRRHEILNTYLTSVSGLIDELDVTTKSKLLWFGCVGNLYGVRASVTNWKRHDDGKEWYTITVNDKNGKTHELEHRYSEFHDLNVILCTLDRSVMGRLINRFPPKVQNCFESHRQNTRMRRYELDQWLLEITASLNDSIKAEVFAFLDLRDDGELKEESRRLQEVEGEAVETVEALHHEHAITPPAPGNDRLSGSAVGVSGREVEAQTESTQSVPIPIQGQRYPRIVDDVTTENPNMSSTPADADSVASSSCSDLTTPSITPSSSFTPSSLGSTPENYEARGGQIKRRSTSRRIGKVLSKVGLSKKKVFGSAEKQNFLKTHHSLSTTAEYVGYLEAFSHSMRSREVVAVLSKMEESPGIAVNTVTVVLAVILEHSNSRKVLKAAVEFLASHQDRLNFTDLVNLGGPPILCYSLKKNINDTNHVGAVAALLVHLAQHDPQALKDNLPSDAKGLFHHTKAIFEPGSKPLQDLKTLKSLFR